MTSSAAPGGSYTFAGRTVARVGYGAMQLNPQRPRAEAVQILRRAVELGVNHIDTAQFYAEGFVNDVIREAIRPEDDVLIVSKVGAVPDPGGEFPLRLAQRPEELRAGVEENLTGLGVEQIPVVNLRRAERGPGLRAAGDQDVDIDDQLAVLIELREQGKIGAIGLSSITAESVRHALPAGIVCVQNAYSMLAREDEDLLRLCAAENIAWVPYFPLGGAFPGLPKVTEQQAVIAAARANNATPAQVGLAWLLHHAPHVLLIPGTATREHLEQNVAAGAITLDAATLAELDAVLPRTSAQ